MSIVGSCHMCDHSLLQNKLTKGDNKPLDLDLTFICQYSAKQGIKVCKQYEKILMLFLIVKFGSSI